MPFSFWKIMNLLLTTSSEVRFLWEFASLKKHNIGCQYCLNNKLNFYDFRGQRELPWQITSVFSEVNWGYILWTRYQIRSPWLPRLISSTVHRCIFSRRSRSLPQIFCPRTPGFIQAIIYPPCTLSLLLHTSPTHCATADASFRIFQTLWSRPPPVLHILSRVSEWSSTDQVYGKSRVFRNVARTHLKHMITGRRTSVRLELTSLSGWKILKVSNRFLETVSTVLAAFAVYEFSLLNMMQTMPEALLAKAEVLDK